MVNVLTRMRRLRTLLAIRLGPGAAVLPNEIKRIHLNFAYKLNDGNMGPRQFWRHMLPRLKYHNPGIPMTVERFHDPSLPSTLSIHIATNPSTPSGPTPAQPGTTPAATASTSTDKAPSNHIPADRVIAIDMKHKNDEQIWNEVLQATGARVVEATPEETDELRQLDEERRRAEVDSKRSLEVMAKRKREEALLAQARGEVGLGPI